MDPLQEKNMQVLSLNYNPTLSTLKGVHTIYTKT
jgi:hypothetical protein